MQETEEEKRNRKLGMIISASVHALLLLVFLFIMAWREPDPPLPEYGIELNFGTSTAGTGEIQPEQPAEPTDNEEEAAPEELPEEVEEQPVEETQPEEVAKPTEEVVETTANTQESHDVIPEVKKEVKKPEEKEEKKVEEKKAETKPVETKPITKPETGAKGDEGTKDTPKNANHGDKQNSEGDQGDEKGTLDSRALYGNAGGGDGPALNIVGWTWDRVPNKKDASSENGTILFKFTIDEYGEVIQVRVEESSVSPSVAKFYEDQLRETTFSKTGTGIQRSPTTTGTVTFVIKSK